MHCIVADAHLLKVRGRRSRQKYRGDGLDRCIWKRKTPKERCASALRACLLTTNTVRAGVNLRYLETMSPLSKLIACILSSRSAQTTQIREQQAS